jgi:hypothetical protein
MLGDNTKVDVREIVCVSCDHNWTGTVQGPVTVNPEIHLQVP